MSDARAGGSGTSHRVRSRLWKQLRRPLFDFYVRILPLPPLLLLVSPRNRQFLRDMRAIHCSGRFDVDWYRQRYPDVVPDGMDPLEHFCRYGWHRGLDPNPGFAVSLYLIRHPEAAAGNPLVHALRTTRDEAEGEEARPQHPNERSDNAERWYDAAAPELSIVILNFNKAALTRECLRSIWHHTEGCRYEIIVVDNGSDAQDVAQLEAHPDRFRLLRLSENRFFGEGNNIGAEQALGTILCLMNNDVFVTPHWLEPMLEVLRARDDCGMVGPRFVYPDGRTQEVGARVEADGRVRRLNHGVPAAETAGLPVQAVDYVSAAAVLLRKTVFAAVSGFAYAWEPVYYEDTDLCFKIASAGLRTYCCPSSTVIHHESVTTSDSGHGLRLSDVKEINRAKFQERWSQQPVRAPASGPGFRPVPDRPAREATSRAAFLFTAERLAPSGSIRYLLAIAQTLQHSHRVCLVTPERYSRLRLLAVARELGLDLDHVQPLALEAALEAGTFEVAVVMAEDGLPPIPAPASRSLFLTRAAATVDSDALRCGHDRLAGYGCVLVACGQTRSQMQRQIERLHLPPIPVEVLPPPICVLSEQPAGEAAAACSLLHVGRFLGDSRCRNQHRLIEAFHALCATSAVPCELHLAGTLPPEAEHRAYYRYCRDLASDAKVRFHLDTPRDRLDALYRGANVYWHTGRGREQPPGDDTAVGASLGIALREAMAAGRLVVTLDRTAPPDMIEHGVCGIVAAEQAELVAATKRALQCPLDPEMQRMRACAMDHARTATDAAFAARFIRILQDLPAAAGGSRPAAHG